MKQKEGVRYIDTGQYLSMVCEVLREGKSVVIPISGNSMSPFLADGRDAVMLKQVKGKIRRGDIVLYQRRNGQFVLHRIIRRKGNACYMAGDAQDVLEGPLGTEEILAVAEQIRRKGTWKRKRKGWDWFFAWIWPSTVGKRKRLFWIWRKGRHQHTGD